MQIAIGERQRHMGRKPGHQQYMNAPRVSAEPTGGRAPDAGDDPGETLTQAAMQTWLEAVRADAVEQRMAVDYQSDPAEREQAEFKADLGGNIVIGAGSEPGC